MSQQPRHTLLITGAAGYVGAMLCDQFSKRSDVERILALDKDPLPKLLEGNQKVKWLDANTSDGSWQEEAAAANPDIVIHTAWQIRCFYGDKKKEWLWNVEGSLAVFRFAFETASVRKLIHFSTASIYGAYAENTIEHEYKEDEPMREHEYRYGVEKRKVEEELDALRKRYEARAQALSISIVRPAAITGPRGRAMHHRFGLQSALSGTLKGSFLYRLVRLLVSFVPATKGWCRQFVHEDDVSDIIGALAFGYTPWECEAFNLAPPGPPVLPEDMAKAVGKRAVSVPPPLIRFVYFLFWHGTRGKIPTAPGSWRFYSYPVVMDGTKVTKLLGHRYKAESREAFVSGEGRYGESA